MIKYKWIIVAINLIILLVYFNFSVLSKEKILEDGTLVLLKLAPVDPRSLMQGDYMILNYEIAELDYNEDVPKRGYCIVTLDENGVAHKVRLQENKLPLSDHEYAILYNKARWDISLGAESFFFEEGQAEKYENAEYGGLKVDRDGNSVLVGLYDENFRILD